MPVLMMRVLHGAEPPCYESASPRLRGRRGRRDPAPTSVSDAREGGELLYRSPTVQGGVRFCVPFLALLALLSCVRAAPTVAVRALPSPGLSAYGQAEWVVALDKIYSNPFDPDEIALDAAFTGPKGQVLRLPGFWFQGFRRQANADGSETLLPQGSPEWRVRFCPPAPGRWRLVVSARDATGIGTAQASAFAVLPSKAPGFVRRGPGDSRYLEYDNGASFFPVGENVCWAGRGGLSEYETWFPKLSAAGGNYARLWMSNRPLEHGSSGLGRYDLMNAWYFDQVLALAARHGLRCMAALGTYSEFTVGGFFNEGQWPVNPYNKANGGPAAAPADFWTDAKARAFYRRRLRYLVARYGAQPSLAFWEFWNETEAPVPWLAEMGTFLKQTDPYHHLVTNSYSTTGTAAVWDLPQMDFTQTHRYGDEGSVKDITPLILDDARLHDRYGKPHFMGEFGISWRGDDSKFDPAGLGTNLHNGLWASALTGNAGGASIWWWDSYVEPKNQYPRFTGLARFAAAVDWPHRRFAPLALPAPTRGPNAPETFTDMVLTPTAAWGDKATAPVVLHPDGTMTGGPLLSNLFGPEKPDNRSVLILRLDLPRPTTLTLHIGTVSNKARLLVGLDGKPAADYVFNAAPGQGGGYESTKSFPEYGGVYQAVFNTDRVLALTAGPHVVTLENTEGDWLQLSTLTLARSLSSRLAFVRTAALQDSATGETLLWLQDPESNWFNDREGRAPLPQSGLRLALPVPRPGAYTLVWWDTRSGVPVKTVRLSAPGKLLRVSIPTFTRDIALRLVPDTQKGRVSRN